MKSVDEIRQGQKACGSGSCYECPYVGVKNGEKTCCDHMMEDTLACIDRLLTEKEELIKKIESLLAEREMMIKALQREAIACDTRKHSRGLENAACEEADFYCGVCDNSASCLCAECSKDNDKWEWGGVWEEDETHD